MSDTAWGQTGTNLAYQELDQDGAWPAAAKAWYWTAVVITWANLGFFFVLHRLLLPRDSATDALKVYYKRMRAAGLAVLAVFAYRTFFIVATLDRLVWYDIFLSCILLIKLLHYVEELANVGMIILATREISQQITKGNGNWWTYTDYSTKLLGVAVIVGQIFSFVALVKKSNYYLIGRSWSSLVGWASIVPVMGYVLFSSCKASRDGGDGPLGKFSMWNSDGQRGFLCLGTGILFATAMFVFLVYYVIWLCVVDLPTFYSRFGEDYEELAPDLGFLEGLWDALTFRVPTTDWDVWKHVVWWNTICATFGSWFAIFLSTGPLLAEKASSGGYGLFGFGQ
jgi:hypothetical protein